MVIAYGFASAMAAKAFETFRIFFEGGPMVEPLKAPDYFTRAFVEWACDPRPTLRPRSDHLDAFAAIAEAKP